MDENTYSTKNFKLLTIEDIKKWSIMIEKKEEKELPKGLDWFVRIMNKFGWHRKYEIIILDKEVFEHKVFKFPTL